MSEKLADDYGFTKFVDYLKKHCYTGGTNGTFQIATNDDIDNLVLDATDTDPLGGTVHLWSDKLSLKDSIKKSFRMWGRLVEEYSILDGAHVSGNSNIYEWVVNTYGNDRNKRPYMPYWNKLYVKSWVKALKAKYGDTLDAIKTARLAEIKARYNAYQATYNANATASGYTGSGSYTPASNDDIRYADEMFPYLLNSSGESIGKYVSYSKTYKAKLKTDDAIKALFPNGQELAPNIPYGEMLIAVYGSIQNAVEHYLAEV